MKYHCRYLFTYTLILAFLIGSLHAQNKQKEAAAIAYAKRILVSRLEAGQPRVPFAKWFQSVVGKKVKVNWEVNDCGEQTGTPADRGREFVMCVETSGVNQRGYTVGVQVAVGTFRKGITGKPMYRIIYVERRGESQYLENLNELVEKLKEVR